MTPIQFPTSVPLVGQAITVHPLWFVTAPITCNCDGKVPLLVLFGAQKGPTVCPSCLNVYGVTAIRFDSQRNVPPAVTISVIGKAQRNVTDEQVATKLEDVLHKLDTPETSH